jgi:hypothetical protein
MANSSFDENRRTTLLVRSSVLPTTLLNLTSTPIAGVDPLNVAIVDASGVQITSFGGGTQYTDGGATPAHPVGPTLIYDNAGTLTAVSDSNPLPISGTISTTGLATSSNQTDGSQLTQIVDSLGNAVTVTGNKLDVNASIDTTGLATETTLDSIDTNLASLITNGIYIRNSSGVLTDPPDPWHQQLVLLPRRR